MTSGCAVKVDCTHLEVGRHAVVKAKLSDARTRSEELQIE